MQYKIQPDNVMNKLFYSLSFVFVITSLQSQVLVSTATGTPHASAMLEVVSTTKGVLLPRMTTAQRNAIASPAAGLLVYDNSLNKFFFYNGTAWTEIGAGAGGGGGNYTAGAGISILSNVITNTGDVNASDDITTATSAAGDLEGTFPTLQIKSNAVGTLEIADASITAAKLAQMGATNGQFLRWNGTAWVPSALPVATLIQDSDGDTKVTTAENSEDNVVRLHLAGSQRISFRQSASLVPRMEFHTSSNNVFIGYNAGENINSGTNNTALGNFAGEDITSGIDNTFTGNDAGRNTTTGSFNVFTGQDAGQSNTTGSGNTGVGTNALTSNITGINNVAIGTNSGFYNTVGSGNTFVGRSSGEDNTTADSCSFFGYGSGRDNTIGTANVAVGFEAGRSNSTGDKNTFIGASAGYSTNSDYHCFIGFEAGMMNTTGSGNVNVGYRAGKSNTTGSSNVCVGRNAGLSATAASNNILIGSSTGIALTTGEQNTLVGHAAGFNNVVGTGNVFLGYHAGFNELGNNKLYIHNSGTLTPLIYGEFDTDRLRVNNKLGIGRDAATNALEVNGNYASKTLPGSWAANSDRRLKSNIRYLETSPETALEKVLKMRGVTYEWNDDKTGMARPRGQQIGFIAQDLQQIFPEKVWADADGYLQTAYGDYDALFVESFRALYFQSKNQAAEIEKLKLENAALTEKMGKQQRQMDEMASKIERLEKMMEQLAAGKK